MLLSNLSRLEKVCAACLKVEDTPIKSLRKLVDLFAKEGLNPNANYDYLAHVFANLSADNVSICAIRADKILIHETSLHQMPNGREALLGLPDSLQADASINLPSSAIPLADLVVFTQHSNATRRVSVASTLKNCAFVQLAHELLLSSGSINFLPYILLPLCGPEEFDLDEQEKLPEECHFLPPEKERDPDPSVRLMLVETLILLSGTRSGRDTLRAKGVYEVVRTAHKVERDEDVRIAIERVVNLLMRDEGQDTKIEEIPSSNAMPTNGKLADDDDDDEDLTVQEV